MADIFISYSRKDSAQALALAERLRSNGMEVWMDTASLAAAQEWSAEIVEAIKACSVFIVLLSPHSVESGNVTKEVSLASQKKKKIIPLVIERCELNSSLEYSLAGIQHVHLSDEGTLVRSFEKLGIGLINSGGILVSAKPSIDSGTSTTLTLLRIAVLPFEDQSPAHDNEWFSDGLTDELISTLNKLDALFVLDRKSSKIYKDANMTVKQIAHELNVRYIVTGAVRKAGEKIRIQASLVDASNGATLWDEKFGGTMDDIFEIQEKTALDICEGLKLKLTPEEEQLLDEKLTNSPEAYELYLQARTKANIDGDFLAAIELCEKAVALDPKFLPVYGSMTIFYSNLYRLDRTQTHLLAKQKELINTMVEIDPKAHYLYPPRANYYLNLRENELALEMAQKAVETMPKRWGSYSVLGFIHNSLHNFEESIAALKKADEIDPSYKGNIFAYVISYYQLGMIEKAHEEFERGREFLEHRIENDSNNLKPRVEYMTCAEAAGEKEISMREANFFLSLPEISPYLHYEIGGILCRNNKIEEGCKHLKMAIDGGYTEFSELDIDWFSSLKGTPEYEYLVAHIVKE